MGPIGFIGAGRVARLLAAAWGALGDGTQREVLFWTPSMETATAFQKVCSKARICTVEQCMTESEYVYLAVPSDAAVSVLCQDGVLTTGSGAILSLCSSIGYQQLKAVVPSRVVVRMFPSLGCQIGKGLITVYRSSDVAASIFDHIASHLKIYGEILVFDDEDRFLETCPPICFSAILLQIVHIAEQAMLSRATNADDVRRVLRQCFGAAGQLVRTTDIDFQEGAQQVATPGGITEQGIRRLEAIGLDLSASIDVMYDAVEGLQLNQK